VVLQDPSKPEKETEFESVLKEAKKTEEAKALPVIKPSPVVAKPALI